MCYNSIALASQSYLTFAVPTISQIPEVANATKNKNK